MSDPVKRTVLPIHPVTDVDAKVYPRSVQGRHQTVRKVFLVLTQVVFFGLCWLPWNGRQAVLLDLDARRFYLFDLVLWPQDTIYLAILLTLSALALFLFTAVAGRLWCGYTCPQTVYTEVFLWLEKAVEGDRSRRIKLDAAPWGPRKLAIKAAKHSLWLGLSLWMGITLVGYFTPMGELLHRLAGFDLGPWEAFWILFYALAAYSQAGFMREHMCKYICPYAQFQFVMFDRDTLNITYDRERGEPRGSRRAGQKAAEGPKGDCVDCGICVQVCPTGIDIRDGLQLECIGCAACVDACDQVMDKLQAPRGLIRYSTENAVQQGLNRQAMVARVLRPRVLIYLGIFLIATTATAHALWHRPGARLQVVRDRAVLAREATDGRIENVYAVQVQNASEAPHRYRLVAQGLPDMDIAGDATLAVAAAGVGELTVAVRARPGPDTPSGAHPIRMILMEDRSPPESPITVVDTQASFWLP